MHGEASLQSIFFRALYTIKPSLQAESGFKARSATGCRNACILGSSEVNRDREVMIRKRTPWMTAIGVLDIVLGILATLLAVALFYVGLQVNSSVETITTSLEGTSAREFVTNETILHADKTEQELAAIQAFILPNAAVSFLLGLILILSGIGTLKVARWARPLSMAWAVACLGWLLFMEILQPVDFDPLSFLLLIYPIVVLYLFSTSDWKRSFKQGTSVAE